MRTRTPDLLYIRSPRLNQLLILTALGEDPFLTQATLAHRCRLSVAMVNNYLKEQCDAGMIEYRRKSLKSVSYHVTDLGRAQMDILEAEVMADAIARFALAKEQILKRLMGQVQDMSLHRVILFGTGHLAEMVFHALAPAGVRVIGVCNDQASIGSDWCGCPVFDFAQIGVMAPDAVVITDWSNTDTIWNRLKTYYNGSLRVIRLDGHCVHGTTSEIERRESHYTAPWA